MKTLLYLEDDGYLRSQTIGFLREDGFSVIESGRIDQAKEYLYNLKNAIDCIITDLNMNDEWLGEYRGESNGCLLSGWVWLNRYVYADSQFRKIPCIIYSGYIRELEEHLREKGQLNLLGQYNVFRVPKGGNDDSGYEELLKKLRMIFRE